MRKFVLRPEPTDDRDYLFAARASRPTVLPPRIDLRNERMPPVYDQGLLGSCTAHAAIALREYLFATNAVRGGLPFRLSRLYLYYYSRDQSGMVREDNGAYIRDVFKVLHKRGVPNEQYWPYNEARVFDHPSSLADAGAYAFRISEYQRLLNLQEIKAALANDQPVVFGMQVYESFLDDHGGRIPTPDPSKEYLYGSHAMLAVGYDDAQEHVIVRNSWGPEWGDGGYCYVPYSLFYWPAAFDFWTCRADPE